MNKAKCPLCSGDLIQSEEFPYFYSCQSTNWKSDADKLCELDDCAASVPVWETLRRTRKALEIIKKEMSKETMPDFAVIHNALKTALEQKDK